MLILFYYFSQHFITIFVQHLVAIFLHVLRDIYKGRNSLRKYILDVQNLCLIRHSAIIFLAHFYTQNHKLIQLYHTIHLTFCQVKIALNISIYFLQNTTIKHFTHHLFPQTFLCVPFTSCLFKKITHHPPRAACLLHEHLCLSRTSSIFYVRC